MGWLGASRLLQIAVAFLVGAWVARHLGPDDYGTLAFALAWVALFSSLFQVGADSVLVRNFVTSPERAGTAFATVLMLRTAVAIVAMGGAVVVALLAGSNTPVVSLIAVLAVAQCVRATDVAEFWFQSRVESKFTVLANASAVAVSATLRVVLILRGASVAAFIWATAIEWVLQTALMWGAFARYGRLEWNALRPSSGYAKTYAGDVWPLIISGVASTVYLRIDQVMLERMSSLQEVGRYAVVSGLVQTGYFLPTMVCASLFPALVRARGQDRTCYELGLRRLFALLIWSAVALSAVVSGFAEFIVLVVFGVPFAGSAPMLAVAVWSWVFVFFMLAAGRHLVVENLTLVLLGRTVLGAMVNLTLNALLIPRYGGVGAAWATLASFAAASLIGNLPHPRSRPLTRMFFQALDPRRLPAIFRRSR